METKTTETRYGSMEYFADDAYVGKSLEAYGEYCQGEVDLWARFIKPGATVLDIGGNIGASARPLSSLVGIEGKVFSFEPQYDNFTLLKRNLSPCANATAVHLALGVTEQQIQIPSLGQILNHNYGGVEIGSGSEFSLQQPLDNWLSDTTQVAFMKIDVEGMEADVINGGRKTIKRCRPILYTENDRPEKSAVLVKLLDSLGYCIYEHHTPLFSPNNYKNNHVNLWPNVVSINVLCVPQEKVEQYKDELAGMKLLVPERPTMGRTGWAGIVRLGGIGDNLIAASVLRPLKALGYKVEVISQDPQSCVFENNPFIDKLSVKDPARDLPQGNMLDWQMWFKSRSREYDVFANLSHSCEGLLALFPAMSSFWWPAEARRKICGRSYVEMVHDIVGVPYQFGPVFFPTASEIMQAELTRATIQSKHPGPIVVWCIAGTRIDKIYPHTPVVVARLIKELGVNVVLTGAPPPSTDHQLAAQIVEHVIEQNSTHKGVHEAITTTAGDWPIRRVLTFVTRADLVITPDTGPAWAAAWEPMPKIVLHSHASIDNIAKHWYNTTSLVNRVPCWPCHQLHDGADTCYTSQESAGMKVNKEKSGAPCISVSVEEIVQAVREALELGSAPF